MAYHVLNDQLLPKYLSSIMPFIDVLDSANDLEISEIGDGNLNYVYRVKNRSSSAHSIIVKQAVPYLRIEGESWPLSRNRIIYESRALQLYNKIVPDYVPALIYFDEDMSVIVMEDLGDVDVLRYQMVKGSYFPGLGHDIGKFLALTLFQTSYLCMASIERRHLMNEFILNDELCKLTEDFIFTFPFIKHPSNYKSPETVEYALSILGSDPDYKAKVLQLKELFMSKNDALLHGDLHTGSLMVGRERVYIIDTEFAFFGPFAFDIGKIIANFLLCYTSHFTPTPNYHYQSWLLDQCVTIWDTFRDHFIRQWNAHSESGLLHKDMLSELHLDKYKQNFMRQILRDAIGFCACCIARRTVGLAGVIDIRGIQDSAERTRLEKINIDLSHMLMLESNSIDNIRDFQSVVNAFFLSHYA